MANVYDESTLTGFNTDPPSDAGAQTEENTVEWAKHIQKIGTPLKNFSESINSNISTGFAKATMLGGVKAVSTTYTLLATDQGKVLNCTGTFTLTLLTAATAGSQFVVMFVNTGTGIITVDGAGAETISGVASFDLYPLDSLIITSDGSNWQGSFAKSISLSTPTNGQVVTYNSTTKKLENTSTTSVGTFVDDASGRPRAAASELIPASVITESTWESIGPTASGATNIWTALDSVPAGCDWIEITLFMDSTSATDTASTVRRGRYFGRKGGSSAAIGSSTSLLETVELTDSSGNGYASSRVSVKVPVDTSIIFELYWDSDFNSTINTSCELVGYGYNP